ncbi:MAG TPA: HDIG domain-containing protein [Solirubrobacteraceae bacterium]|nr:HDIG domain-containing protein [Solirubrobacteraceae bacterium]
MSGSPALAVSRRALAGKRAWLVGGAVRDDLLGRDIVDLDIVLDGDVERAARAIARESGAAAAFQLSQEFGAWRVSARDGAWQVDIEPLHGGTIEADLELRDLTVNAIAEPLAGGAPIDPLGGVADLRAGRLRLASPLAFEADPLRVLRLVRIACELDLVADGATLAAARAAAPRLLSVSPERIFAELRRIVESDRAVAGIRMLADIGALAIVLPELEELRGVEQSSYHHLDVYDHTLAVLDEVVALGAGGPRLEGVVGDRAAAVDAVLAEPLADSMTRGAALRWGALLHDIAKPQTAGEAVAGRVTFIGHDEQGAQVARRILTRLRSSERLRGHVAALVRHHLRLGFLVHEPQPLAPRTVYRYLRATAPVEVDVTLLSVCDRLATRGEGAERAIGRHVELARPMLARALAWRAAGPPRPPLNGNELTLELGIAPGPDVGRLLEMLVEADWAGELADRDDALAMARELLASL